MAALAAAEGKLTKALSSVAAHARGHMWLGLVNIVTRRAAQGIAKCEHALSVLERFLSAAPKKRRLILAKPCASVRAIRRLMFG